MSSEFLEDLTRAGRAVWEQYLQPLDTPTPESPPAFPVWENVVEANAFRNLYGDGYDWRLWLSWSVAFSWLAATSAAAEGTAEAMHTAHKFIELTAVHAGDRCAGEHGEHMWVTGEALRDMPDFKEPVWSAAVQDDMDRFRFEVAAHQEWRFLQGSFIPERELNEIQVDGVIRLTSEIENDLFKDTDFHTLLGLVVLTSHLSTLAQSSMSSFHETAARRVLCSQTHAMSDAASAYVTKLNVARILSGEFPIMFNPELN